MCAAGILALSNTSTAARHVVDDMVYCAQRRECIAPTTATQLNHRFEQAALSIALATRNIRCHNSWKFYAYLDGPEDVGKEETSDVTNGFGRENPIWISRRCRQPYRHAPLLSVH